MAYIITSRREYHHIIINVMHNCLLSNYSFSFELLIMKHGRTTKRRSESNMVETKSGLKSFRLSSCHFYGRHHI